MIQVLSYTVGKDDPRRVIFDAIGDGVSKLKLAGGGSNKLLVATAPSAERSKGGIIFADKTRQEGRFQGKVGLVLAMGSTAFKYAGPHSDFAYEGEKPEVGDWVFYRPADTWESAINGVPVRFVADYLIAGIVDDPEAIY